MKYFRLSQIGIFTAVLVVLLLGFISYFFYYFFLAEVKAVDIIEIPLGSNTGEVIEILQESGVKVTYRRARLFKRLTKSGITAGPYDFTEDLNRARLFKRLDQGDFGIDPITVTIPEGFSVERIAEVLTRQLDFSPEEVLAFKSAAEPLEGYLFPDTYRIFPTETPESIVQIFHQNFLERTAGVEDLTKEEIILASIIEREVPEFQDRRLVADILWRRLEIGMRLQVDATLNYLLGKTSAELTVGDLALDSPYNSYATVGLPPTPISNPGIESILAVRDPLLNDYWYFLSGHDGTTHFARTHDEHLQNRALYLD